MADDRLTAELAAIKERLARTKDGFSSDAVAYLDSQADVPRLLAAIDAALERHQRLPLYERVHDYKGNVICGHGEDYDGDRHFEGDDGEWLCADKLAGVVCETCVDEAGGERIDWPCPEYEAILAALTGKGGDGT